MLPVLALNQYKIANPTILARIPENRLTRLLRGYGYQQHIVSDTDPAEIHQKLAATLGWRCPPVVDGDQVEGTFRAHQVPLPEARTNGTAPSGPGAVVARVPP